MTIITAVEPYPAGVRRATTCGAAGQRARDVPHDEIVAAAAQILGGA
jgi:hypothetical protein